ncbi:arylesterase [Marinihelvus fidelis]|uniref:Arylesterase n=2 Tax=Marinihelvus fidelis TaxID=2613842 RepID=A0A5N0TI86_9GAMM|nr:arylesterase [Marinihelvus fidelis]
MVAGPVLGQERPVLLVIGDSLSAGYNMPLDAAWPRLLEQRLQDHGHDFDVVNASVTGDTTQGGRTRLPRLLERHQPAWVIIELGGNDGLRGLPLATTRANLEAMVRASTDAGAQVMLTGIVLPPNYGSGYTQAFEAIYTDLAEQHRALLVPFFMEGVALTKGMMQADGIHPNEQAQPILLDNVWAVLAPALSDS